MAVRKILLLGDQRLYSKSNDVIASELSRACEISETLSDTLFHFKQKYEYGRAIAAPQIAEPYRIIYMQTGGMEITFINPHIVFPDEEMVQIWDNCLSFPKLHVKVPRYKNCQVFYKDLNFKDCEITFTDDLSELFQHEYDHLEGILSTQRAIDNKSFSFK